MSKRYDLAIFIGRMAPLHNAHISNIEVACNIADEVLILLGSANAPRDEKNPFTNDQRKAMIHAAIPRDEDEEIAYPRIDFMNDQPSNDLWAAEVQRKAMEMFIRGTKPSDVKIAIVGHKKDESSFYLDMFPTWDFIETGAKMYRNEEDVDEELAATKIRSYMFEDEFEGVADLMPPAVWNYINQNYIGSDLFKEIQAEYMYHIRYERDLPRYPINSVTTDAVVLCKSHILLIRRKNIPGKGKLALPGGFLNTNETVEDGMLRELDEETKLHVSERTLRKSIIDVKVFDKPSRSLRGRILTFAHTLKIDTNHDGSLPRVYGSDDADKAFWVPIADIMAPENATDFFEDHHNIIMTMIGRAAKQDK